MDALKNMARTIAENPSNQATFENLDYTLDQGTFAKRYGKKIAERLSGLVSEKVGQEVARMIWAKKRRGADLKTSR